MSIIMTSMTIPITTEGVLFVVTIASVVFAIYQSFKKPQDKQELDNVKLADRISEVERQVIEVRQTHLVAVEKDFKELTTQVQSLALSVTRLSTIIDERIPKVSAPR
jgi:hypothetical protein